LGIELPDATISSSITGMGDARNLEVKVNSPVEIGALLLKFEYAGIEFGAMHCSDGMDIITQDSESGLAVLIYSLSSNRIEPGQSTVFSAEIGANGDVSLAEYSISDSYGRLLNVSKDTPAVLPTVTALECSYPNPFNANTIIKFSLADAGTTNLVIYDIAGRKVCDLVNGDLNAGYHQVIWNGINSYGVKIASGIYFARLTHSDLDLKIRMTLLK
jgi:hypothetical protein